jgi:chromate transporter
MTPDEAPPAVPLRTAARAWWSVSLRTFGGPAGQIAVMHREFVDERRWVGERRFLHALSYCTLLPGPEAQQLAVYLGWLLNGIKGALIAGWLFVLPGFVCLLGLSLVYVRFGDTELLQAVFVGLAPAVLAVVAQALWRLARRAATAWWLGAVAVGAFLSLTFFRVPFPVVIAVAGAIGLVAHRWLPAATEREVAQDWVPLIPDDAEPLPTSVRRTVRVVLIGAVLWVTPVVVLALVLGRDSVFVDQGRFFGGTALVTFGGAYAVLSFVAQRAVEVYGWLSPAEMVKGLALAETTPGPLVMVLQFVAFLGAYRNPGDLEPWVAGVLASVLLCWVLFIPSFVFVLAGAPYLERLRHSARLRGALTAITAAVVGVIANLAWFFALNTLFRRLDRIDSGPVRFVWPVWESFDLRAACIAAVAALLLWWRRWGVLQVLGVCALLGIVLGLAG